MVRCNMCMDSWDDSDYVHICPNCDSEDYLMDLE